METSDCEVSFSFRTKKGTHFFFIFTQKCTNKAKRERTEFFLPFVVYLCFLLAKRKVEEREKLLYALFLLSASPSFLLFICGVSPQFYYSDPGCCC